MSRGQVRQARCRSQRLRPGQSQGKPGVVERQDAGGNRSRGDGRAAGRDGAKGATGRHGGATERGSGRTPVAAGGQGRNPDVAPPPQPAPAPLLS